VVRRRAARRRAAARGTPRRACGPAARRAGARRPAPSASLAATMVKCGGSAAKSTVGLGRTAITASRSGSAGVAAGRAVRSPGARASDPPSAVSADPRTPSPSRLARRAGVPAARSHAHSRTRSQAGARRATRAPGGGRYAGAWRAEAVEDWREWGGAGGHVRVGIGCSAARRTRGAQSRTVLPGPGLAGSRRGRSGTGTRQASTAAERAVRRGARRAGPLPPSGGPVRSAPARADRGRIAGAPTRPRLLPTSAQPP
jgi:hypothetical protein